MTAGQAWEPPSTDVYTVADISNGGFSKPQAEAVMFAFYQTIPFLCIVPIDSYVIKLV